LIVRWQRYTHVLKYEIQMCKLDLSSPPLPQSISMDIHVKLRMPINAASQPASSLLHSSSSSLSGSQTPSHPPTGLCYANRRHHYSLQLKAYTPTHSYSHTLMHSYSLLHEQLHYQISVYYAITLPHSLLQGLHMIRGSHLHQTIFSFPVLTSQFINSPATTL